MRRQTLTRLLAFTLLAAGLTLSAVSARQQERKALPVIEQPVPRSECPRPIALTLTAKNPTSFFAGDFAPGQLNPPAVHQSGLGDTSINKNFLYTFQWKKDSACCQITKARLIVNMKSNEGGQTKTSADAGNDGIAMMYLGNVVQPFNEAVYSAATYPFAKGQTATKTWDLTPAALSNLNASGHLSFAVQDDTSVLSATLQIWGCCLSTPRRDGPETQTDASTQR